MGNDVHSERRSIHLEKPSNKDDVFYAEKVNEVHTDFSHKHPIFDVEIEKKGPQFSQIDDKRAEYIRDFAATYKLDLQVPDNIPGLIPKVGNLPITRRFWKRPTTSFERNGYFNIHTKNFNTRITVPFFFVFLLYGWWGHQTGSWYIELYEDNYESRENIYDKLNIRMPPQTKLWLRPG